MPSAKPLIPSFWQFICPRLPRFSPAAQHRRVGSSLYEEIVAQARSEALYRNHGVPDTVNGRFEMTALHMALVVTRLQAEGEAGGELARALLEVFVSDMDDACRRLGIGDMGVPRHVKKAAAAVMDRGNAYRAAMAAERTPDDDPLAIALAANAWETPPGDAAGPCALADYVRRAAASLDGRAGERLLAGTIAFPHPLAP